MFDRPLIDIFMVLPSYYSAKAKNHAQKKVYTINQSLKTIYDFTFNFTDKKIMELALMKHNEIRENHCDTSPLKLAEDLTSGAQEYADQLSLVLRTGPMNHTVRPIHTGSQNIRTFAFWAQRSCPKNADFCIFSKAPLRFYVNH